MYADEMFEDASGPLYAICTRFFFFFFFFLQTCMNKKAPGGVLLYRLRKPKPLVLGGYYEQHLK
jgi:hypothetical protein